MISQSPVYVRDTQLIYSKFEGLKLHLLPVLSMGAMTSSPWHSLLVPNGPVFFLSDFIEEICHFFHS